MASAPPPLSFRCRCGVVRGTFSAGLPNTGIRVVCYCASCRTYLQHLAQQDRLDAAGGTDLFQTTQARLRLEAGADQLRCLRLTGKGPLRWYTACCRSPIANTAASAGFPFMGLFVSALSAGEGRSLDTVLGPVRYRINGVDALVAPPEGTRRNTTVGHVLRMMGIMLRARLGGRRPTAFFTEGGATVAPVERVQREPEAPTR